VLTARGAITNKQATAHSYRVTVRFLDAAGHVAASGATDVPRVAPREQRDWIVQVTYNGNLWANGGTCKASASVIG
jgi:hypothetical protein